MIELAQALARIALRDLDRVVLLRRVGEFNEAALRMAKTATGGYEMLALSRSWHGVTQGAASATYNSEPAGARPGGAGLVRAAGADAVSPAFPKGDGYDWGRNSTSASSSTIASCRPPRRPDRRVDPVIGGVIVPPDGYIKALTERARQRGMLVIVDEAQTRSAGRTGQNVCLRARWESCPISSPLSKTIGAGLALSAVLTTPEIEEKCFENKFHFYTTHASDPLPAAVGLKVLEIILRATGWPIGLASPGSDCAVASKR